jgi:uncharacterized protein with PIN domain
LTLYFDASLYCFLRGQPPEKGIVHSMARRASIKHIIESKGVPHTEVGSILTAGRAVDFSHVPHGPGRVTVTGIKAPFDVTVPTRLRPRPLKNIRFVVDVNVGKLAVLLRMSGIDAATVSPEADETLARVAEVEGRVVLSRDVGLFKRRQITHGRYIRSTHPDDQAREVIAFFGLAGRFRPFSRCLRCNVRLKAVDKKAVLSRLEPKTRKYFNRFNICPGCSRVYWQGSHHEEMRKRLRNWGETKGSSGP